MAKPRFSTKNSSTVQLKLPVDAESTVLNSIRMILSGSAKRIDSCVLVDGVAYLFCCYRQRDDVVRCDLKPAE
jgi:hypothetical protein